MLEVRDYIDYLYAICVQKCDECKLCDKLPETKVFCRNGEAKDWLSEQRRTPHEVC